MAAIDDSSAALPVAYLLFRDPHYEGAANVTSVTSEGSAQLGLVEPATTNRGQAYAYQEGTPSGTTELTLRGQGGAPGVSGGFVHRLATESTAASWKAQNAVSVPFKNNPVQTVTEMYAQGLVYSTLYDRLIVVMLTSATNIEQYYTSADGHLTTPTNTSITITDGDVATPNGGLDIEELPDGTLIMAVQVLRRLLDVDLYTSSDGGTTWTLSQRGISQRESVGVGYGGEGGQNVLRRSGDFLRMMYLAGAPVAAAVTAYTMVSPDRGTSWTNIGTFSVSHWPVFPGDYFVGSAPFDIIGLDDIAGTFLLAVTNPSGEEIKIYIAQGTDDWVSLSAVDWDFSEYATSPVCKGVWFARGMDRIFLYAWIEGSDASEVVCRVVNVTNPTDVSNWQTLGVVSAFKGVLRYGPHRPRAVFAGNRFYHSAGIQDATVAGGADPLVAGHWTLMSGGMDTYPLAPSAYSNGWYLSGFASSFKLMSYNWQPVLGLPTDSGITPYTQVTTSASTSDNKSYVTLEATGTTGQNYYNLAVTPSSSSTAWGHSSNRGFTFCFRIKANSERSTSVDDVGIRIKAPTTHTVLTTGYDFSIRLQQAAIVIYDNVATATRATISTTDAASIMEFRVTISGTSLWTKRRLVSAGATGAWTATGPHTLSSGTITGQRLRVGVINASAATGTSSVDLYEWEISTGSDTFSQRGDLTKPDDMFGTLMTLNPILLTGGVAVGWAGPGSAAGDTYTAALEYTRGLRNLSIASPRYYWESTTLAENTMVFDARSDNGAGGRWQINALMLVGTTDLGVTVQFNDSDSWGAPSASVSLSAALWSNVEVAAANGNNIQLTTTSGTFEAWPGQLVGQYLRFTSGSASGKTYLITADQDVGGSRWVALDLAGSASGAGVGVGDDVTIYTDRMVYLSDTMLRYRFFRLVFPDVSSVSGSLGTATGTHRLGAIIPGHYAKLDRNHGLLDVSFSDNEEHAYSRARSRSGVDHITQEGPSARTVTIQLNTSCDDSDANSETGALPRQLRDLIRQVQDGGTLPTGLVVDSLNTPQRNVMVYGTVGLGGTKLDHAVPAYKSSDGKWHFPATLDLSFEEMV